MSMSVHTPAMTIGAYRGDHGSVREVYLYYLNHVPGYVYGRANHVHVLGRLHMVVYIILVYITAACYPVVACDCENVALRICNVKTLCYCCMIELCVYVTRYYPVFSLRCYRTGHGRGRDAASGATMFPATTISAIHSV